MGAMTTSLYLKLKGQVNEKTDLSDSTTKGFYGTIKLNQFVRLFQKNKYPTLVKSEA
jgi:hypothetical protein